MPIFNPILVGGGSDTAPFSDEILGFFSSVKGQVVKIQNVIDVNGEAQSCKPALSLPCEYWADRAALPSKLKEILGPDYVSDAVVIDGTLSAASFHTQPGFPCTVTIALPAAAQNSSIRVVVYDSSGGYSRLDCTVGNGTVKYTINECVEYSDL